MASEVKTNKISPSTSTTVTLGDASDLFQLPASAEIDIASGATLDVNGTIDLTGATTTGFPSSGFNSVQFITSGNWTRPSDITKVVVTLIGAGGGGGGGRSGASYWGGAGGGGGAMRCVLDVSSMTSATLGIGTAGTAGGVAGSGGTGGSTTWTGVGGSALVLTAVGGAGGSPGLSSAHGAGGAGGVPVVTTGSTAGGDLLLTGSKGGKGSGGGNVPGIAMLGYGLAPYNYGDSGNENGVGYGWAGWGGDPNTAGTIAGGGLIIVWEYK